MVLSWKPITKPEYNMVSNMVLSWKRNQTADFFAKIDRFFYRELHFIGCSIPVWLPRPPQV